MGWPGSQVCVPCGGGSLGRRTQGLILQPPGAVGTVCPAAGGAADTGSHSPATWCGGLVPEGCVTMGWASRAFCRRPEQILRNVQLRIPPPHPPSQRGAAGFTPQAPSALTSHGGCSRVARDVDSWVKNLSPEPHWDAALAEDPGPLLGTELGGGDRAGGKGRGRVPKAVDRAWGGWDHVPTTGDRASGRRQGCSFFCSSFCSSFCSCSSSCSPSCFSHAPTCCDQAGQVSPGHPQPLLLLNSPRAWNCNEWARPTEQKGPLIPTHFLGMEQGKISSFTALQY